MRIPLTKPTFIIVSFVIAIIGIWEFQPSWVAKPLLQISYVLYGFESKSVKVDSHEIHYLEGGQGETILLLHGIFSRKENWMEMASSLTDDFHILALDLPGFGDNSPLSISEYSVTKQTENLLQVLDRLDVKKAHFAANSMGAQLATLAALERPEVVSSLAFIGSPLGVPTPVKSDMDISILQQEYPLVVNSKEDFYKRNKWVSPNSISVPSPILETWATNEASNAERNKKIWNAVHSERDVQNLLVITPSIDTESLIIWCDLDRIFHVSGAELLDSVLVSSKLVIHTNCGHVPMIDKPEEIASIYLDFLKSIDD